MHENSTLGERLASVRKRRGLTQRELAEASGLSVSMVRKIEQGEIVDIRVETARKFAVALKVRTSALLSGPEPEAADPITAESWDDVRRALYDHHAAPQDDEDMPTAEGVLSVLNAAKPAVAANKFGEVRTVLPGLLRDADTLNGEGRYVRSRVLNLTSWLLTMTRQWEAAAVAAQLAADAAPDYLDAAAAINTACWSLLRQGRLTEARELAAKWADDIEPRFSRAAVRELSIWGRLWLGVANAAIRDNRPGEAEDAMQLARAAAERIGREVVSDGSTTRTFGPVSVAMITAENAAITGNPQRVLDVAQAIPPNIIHPRSASRCRHQLDVANAHVMQREYADAMGILMGLKASVPEWLPQQRYARDVLGRMIERRRTLTPEMRELADAVRLPL